MSSPRAQAPDQPTRQQLDELDALLERMLSLPVRPDQEDEPGPPVTTLVTEPPAVRAPRVGTREQAPIFVATVMADVRPPIDPVLPTPAEVEKRSEPVRKWVAEPTPLDRIIQGPLAAARQEAIQELERNAGCETASEVVSSPINVGPAPANRDREAAPAAELPAALWHPLLALNAGFDVALGRLGPLGRWFVKPPGRAVLGWSGLLFLALAVALIVLDRIGWTW